MKEQRIHDAIGELPEDLLIPVEKLRQKKQYPVMKWAVIAACFCLLLILPLSAGMQNAEKAENLQEEPKEEALQQNVYAGLTDDAGISAFRGKVLEKYENSVLIEPLEGESELRSSDKIVVFFWDLKQVPETEVGDILEIVYDGMIQETYPAQINGTISIQIWE